MKMFLKILSLIVIVILLIVMVIYFNIGVILERAVEICLDYISADLGREGLQITDRSVGSVGVRVFPFSLILHDLCTSFTITQKNVFQITSNFLLSIKEIKIIPDSLRSGSFSFIIKDALITMQPEHRGGYSPSQAEKECDRLEIASLRIPFKINLSTHWQQVIAQMKNESARVMRELGSLAREGYVSESMEFSGSCAFMVHGDLLSANLKLVPIDNVYKLIMDQSDFSIIALKMDETLTRDEFIIYSNNPLRLPRLFRIRDYSYFTAAKMKESDPEFPAGAYKHILWAYLLSKAYGEKFSEEVTDSHQTSLSKNIYSEDSYKNYIASVYKSKKATEEIRSSAYQGKLSGESVLTSTVESTDVDRETDKANNRIGREYARLGYSESSLVRRMLNDGRVRD